MQWNSSLAHTRTIHAMACILSIEIAWPYIRLAHPIPRAYGTRIGFEQKALGAIFRLSPGDDRLMIEVVKKGRRSSQGTGKKEPYTLTCSLMVGLAFLQEPRCLGFII